MPRSPLAHLNLPTGDYETVAGMMLTHLGRIPNPGESLTQQGVRLTVLDMQGSRIARIEIVRV